MRIEWGRRESNAHEPKGSRRCKLRAYANSATAPLNRHEGVISADERHSFALPSIQADKRVPVCLAAAERSLVAQKRISPQNCPEQGFLSSLLDSVESVYEALGGYRGNRSRTRGIVVRSSEISTGHAYRKSARLDWLEHFSRIRVGLRCSTYGANHRPCSRASLMGGPGSRPARNRRDRGGSGNPQRAAPTGAARCEPWRHLISAGSCGGRR